MTWEIQVRGRTTQMTDLRLRPVEASDLEFLRDLANEPEVRRRVVGWDWPLSLAGQERWFESGPDSASTRRFIVETAEGERLGLTGLWDINWHDRTARSALKLGGSPNVRGRGIGTGAIRLLMEFAFDDVGLNRLYSEILATNEASLAAYVRKSGWTKEGVLREHVWRDGSFVDAIQVGILRSEYLGQSQ